MKQSYAGVIAHQKGSPLCRTASSSIFPPDQERKNNHRALPLLLVLKRGTQTRSRRLPVQIGHSLYCKPSSNFQAKALAPPWTAALSCPRFLIPLPARSDERRIWTAAEQQNKSQLVGNNVNVLDAHKTICPFFLYRERRMSHILPDPAIAASNL